MKAETQDVKTQDAREEGSSAGCGCWEETDAKLKERGFRLHGELSALRWAPSGDLPVVRRLPLQRADGSKCKGTDPKTLTISHCPFCGKKYETKEGGEG